jgi:hypothetical protein
VLATNWTYRQGQEQYDYHRLNDEQMAILVAVVLEEFGAGSTWVHLDGRFNRAVGLQSILAICLGNYRTFLALGNRRGRTAITPVCNNYCNPLR